MRIKAGQREYGASNEGGVVIGQGIEDRKQLKHIKESPQVPQKCTRRDHVAKFSPIREYTSSPHPIRATQGPIQKSGQAALKAQLTVCWSGTLQFSIVLIRGRFFTKNTFSTQSTQRKSAVSAGYSTVQYLKTV